MTQFSLKSFLGTTIDSPPHSKTKSWPVIALLTLPAVLPIAVAARWQTPPIEDPKRIYLAGDPEADEGEISRHIHRGMDIVQARDVMRRNGFTYVILVNGSMKKDMTFRKARQEKKCVLLCAKSTDFLVSNSWNVYIYFHKGKVTDLYVWFRSTASDL